MFKPQQDLVFEERAPYEQGFSEVFESYIEPIIHELEEEREKLMKIVKKRKPYAYAGYLIVIGLTILSGSYLFNVTSGSGDFFEYLISGSLIALFLIYSWAYGVFAIKYTTSYKHKILPAIVNFYSNCSYIHDGKIPKQVIKDSELVKGFSSYESEDFISGWYKEHKFSFAEVKVKSGSGKNTKLIFTGVMLHVEMKKKFHGKTVVKADLGGKISNWMSYRSRKKDRVELEDPKFEKLFEVYSTDQVEARYLLTPAFMERLLHLEEVYTGKKAGRVKCSFFDNFVLIAIPRHDNLFEPRSIKESAISTEDLHKFLKEMNEVFGVVDILNLHK